MDHSKTSRTSSLRDFRNTIDRPNRGLEIRTGDTSVRNDPLRISSGRARGQRERAPPHAGRLCPNRKFRKGFEADSGDWALCDDIERLF